jgi:hypothetical protein
MKMTASWRNLAQSCARASALSLLFGNLGLNGKVARSPTWLNEVAEHETKTLAAALGRVPWARRMIVKAMRQPYARQQMIAPPATAGRSDASVNRPRPGVSFGLGNARIQARAPRAAGGAALQDLLNGWRAPTEAPASAA